MTKEQKKEYNRRYYLSNKHRIYKSKADKEAAERQALQDLPRTQNDVCTALESAYCAYSAGRSDSLKKVLLAIAAAELLRLKGGAA